MAGQHNDSRMNIALIMTAVQQGAVVANHVEVTKLLARDGRLFGATVRDTLTGKTWDVKAKVSGLFYKFFEEYRRYRVRELLTPQDPSPTHYLHWTTQTISLSYNLPLEFMLHFPTTTHPARWVF